MAASSSSNSLQQFLDESKTAGDVLVTSFERELGQILNDSKHKQTSKNLHATLNKYEPKLTSLFYKKSLTQIGDNLKSAKEFTLANTHGYGRYLHYMGVALPSLVRLFDQSNQREDTELNLRSVLGLCYCTYKLIINKDSRLMVLANRFLCLSLLHNLTHCLQVALHTESHYWLLYNTITLCYSISRLLMSINLSQHVIEPLIWSCVTMESCVPLMNVRYLQLRGSLYTAVCQCYYTMNHPLEAELFGRRCLEKIHELAQIHSQSNNTNSSYSDIFTEVTIKLCVMIFKRSVLETHKRTRSIMRPKVRPTIKDLLQSQWPRSPTERLIDEMFTGKSAQFLTITECLFDSMTRPLQKAPLHPITDLDNDTINDVYQEIITAGVNLANEALLLLVNEGVNEESNKSLIDLATKGSNIIPLESIIRFIHSCYNVDCMEAFNILSPLTMQYCSGSDLGNSLTIVMVCDEIKDILKRTSVLEDREVWTKSQTVLHILHSSINHCLLSNDLVLDAAVLIWEGCGPLYNSVLSHDIVSSCKPLLTSTGKYINFLNKLLSVFESVAMADYDPVMYTEVLFKYILLLEMDSDLQQSFKKSQPESAWPTVNPFLKYDRAKLLYCQEQLQNGLSNISQSRETCRSNITDSTQQMISVIHAELICTEIRIAVKLSSTIPPKCPFEDSVKPSSLPNKVEKREHEKELWKMMLSGLTAPDAVIPSEEELLKGCGSDKYRSALLLMTIACYSCNGANTVEKDKIHKLLKESYSQLVSSAALAGTTSGCNTGVGGAYLSIPSPPLLVYRSPTTMTFRPAHFVTSQPVLYYSLYGRKASGSNVKVRINDQQFTGLGIEVPANNGCLLRVTGLQPHVEYVFSVAAYGPGGQLIGQSLGVPTSPILAAHSLSHEVAFGILSQCAYNSQNYTIASKSSDILWKQFVYSLTTDDIGTIPTYRLRPDVLSATPTPLLQLFVTSILTGAHSQTVGKGLYPAEIPSDMPLLPSQRDRLRLIGRLKVALRVCGWLNDHALCLQVVIMCYTLLIPFLQLQIIMVDDIIKILLYCLTVLQSLPDNILVSRNDTIINGLHHMIAVIGHALVKALSDLGEKAVIPLIIDLCRSKLILTLPALNNNTDTPTGGGGKLQNPSVTSTLSTEATGSLSQSVFGSSVLFIAQNMNNDDGKACRQRKRKKKTLGHGEIVADESKSLQYKTLEGFFTSTTAGTSSLLHDLELTGQEDPTLLHIAINNLPIQTAYKEVIKFKRRPQHLQYFVHLVNKALLSCVRRDMIIEWSKDVFAWLKRRNEIVLSTKNPQVIKPDTTCQKQPTLVSSLNHTLQSTSITKGDSSLNVSVGVARTKRLTLTSKISLRNSTQLMHISTKDTKMALNRKEGKLPAAMGLSRITRDDLRQKAISSLQSLLPKVWRTSRCRKKFRAVCTEEQPWRAQINMLLASCLLQNIIDNKIGIATPTSNPSKLLPPDWFRFDICGHIIEWVVPPHPPSMPNEADAHPTAPTNDTVVELKQLMMYLQRAIVHGYRGGCWVLVMNGCRLLWNALTILRYYVYYEESDMSTAVLYGTALECLYIGADVIIDVIENINKCINELQVSGSVAMVMTDSSFLYQFLSLSFIVCYTNNHWEKVLTLEQRLSTNQRCALQDLIKPLITESRHRLANRIKTHSSLIVREPVDPAAHLDVKSYNLYGTVGYSLAMSTIPHDSTHDSLSDNKLLTPPTRGEEMIKRCRSLYSLYLSTRNGPVSYSGSVSDIEHIIDGYKEAIQELKRDGAGGGENGRSLQLQAMHELGNILYYLDDKKSASKWWGCGLRFLLHCKEPLTQWRKLDLFKKDCTFEILGLWGCVLGGILASKMGSYIHSVELDMRLEYHHLAAALFKSLFRSSMPHPLNDIDYANYTLGSPFSLGAELFTDYYRCSSSLLLSSLNDTIKELLTQGHALKTLPLLTLYEHTSCIIARNVHHTLLARIYRVESLTQINMFSDAIQCIKRLMTGADLPVLSKEYCTVSDSNQSSQQFNTRLPLNNPKNMKLLISVIEKSLSPSLKELYGVVPSLELVLTKCRLIISLAATCTGIPQDVISHHHDNRPTSSSVSLSSSQGGQQLLKRARNNDTTNEGVKLMLLEHAEQVLTELLQETDSITHTARVYISLSELYICLFRYSTAVNLSLNALRILQNIKQQPAIDSLLWLQTRVTLANSVSLLATPLNPPLTITSICQEGLNEAQAMGSIELAAHFLYSSGVYHFVSVQPPDVDRVRCDITECLQILDNCVELSAKGLLLKSKASLLLAEVMCCDWETDTTCINNMTLVYKGISGALHDQLTLLTPNSSGSNIYHPQRDLKLISDLRLACLMSNIDSVRYKDILREGLQSSDNDILTRIEYLSQLSLASDPSSNGIAHLVEAINASTVLGIDHTRIQQLYITLCEKLVTISNETTPPITNKADAPVARSESTKISKQRSRLISQHKPSKLSPDDNRPVPKGHYQAWVALRLANTCIERQSNLVQLSSELHNDDINSLIPNTLLKIIPDYIINDLSPTKEVTERLINDTEPLPLGGLLPPASNSSLKDGITWFSLIGHYQRLLRKCFKPLLSNSLAGLRTHCLSHLVIPQARILLEFLLAHCESFNMKCAIPKAPPPLLALSDSETTPSVATPTETPSYLMSEEGEVSLIWYESSPEVLKGFITLNHKPIKSIPATPSSSLHMKYTGAEVFIVSVESSKLEELCHLWEELGQKCNQFITEQTTRPLSRSPSRMKRKTIEVAKKGVPLDLQENIEEGVAQLLQFLSQSTIVPVSVQAVPGIARLLKTAKPTPEKGDVYLFFKQVFTKY